MSKKKIVTNVVSLQIELHLDHINEWSTKGYPEEYLMDVAALEDDRYWHSESILKYGFDLLPHPDGNRSIFYHKQIGRFSNNLGATDVLGNANSISDSLKKIAENIHSIQWGLNKNRHVFVTPLFLDGGSHKTIIIAPTDEMFNLHIGDTIDGESEGFDRRETQNETLVDVMISEDKSTKLMRSSASNGGGVFYRNSICRVNAWIPDKTMFYDDYN